jgi:peptidoglycan lytic transglycosylase
MPLSRMVGMCLAVVMFSTGANAATTREVGSHYPLHHRISKSAERHPQPKRRRLLARRRVRHPLRRVVRRPQRRVAAGALRPEIGKAAWYNLAGRTTASGERFRARAATAAHRTLPFFSYARVTNLRNGRSVVVKINDRGPVSRRLLIDLSEGAAAKLHMRHAGIAHVLVHPLSPRETAEASALYRSALASATR